MGLMSSLILKMLGSDEAREINRPVVFNLFLLLQHTSGLQHISITRNGSSHTNYRRNKNGKVMEEGSLGTYDV